MVEFWPSAIDNTDDYQLVCSVDMGIKLKEAKIQHKEAKFNGRMMRFRIPMK